MPIEYRIDDERKVLIASFRGAVDDDQLLDYGKRLLADDDRHRARHELVDLRDVTSAEAITAAGVGRLAAFWRSHYERMAGGKLAILAASDVAYGMARMYQTMREDGPDTIAVFRDEASALAWLAADGEVP